MNSIANCQDGGCIVNLYGVKVIKNAKIALGVHINGKNHTERKFQVTPN